MEKITITIEENGAKTFLTMEKDSTIKDLKEQLSLSEDKELYYKWEPVHNCAIIEDKDCIEIKSVIDRLERDFVAMIKLANVLSTKE